MCDCLVSIIVPVYNVENYLERCINSLINQTYKNIEIILIDDGSTDQSGIICDDIAKSDKRIKVIHKDNGGLSEARNTGIDKATGKYLSFIDSDDYIVNDTIEQLYNSAVNNDCEISICNMIQFNESGMMNEFYKPVNRLTVYYGEQRFETLNQPSVCNKLFKAHLFENIRFPKGKFYEDTFVYHELLYRANKVVLTGHDGYMYLVRKGSILGRPIYTDRYFDFVEAVFTRAYFLLKLNIQPYGYEACLSLYAAYANVVKNIKKTDISQEKYNNAKNQYVMIYNILKQEKSYISLKQKIRLFILRWFPAIHSYIYMR